MRLSQYVPFNTEKVVAPFSLSGPSPFGGSSTTMFGLYYSYISFILSLTVQNLLAPTSYLLGVIMPYPNNYFYSLNTAYPL